MCYLEPGRPAGAPNNWRADVTVLRSSIGDTRPGHPQPATDGVATLGAHQKWPLDLPFGPFLSRHALGISIAAEVSPMDPAGASIRPPNHGANDTSTCRRLALSPFPCGIAVHEAPHRDGGAHVASTGLIHHDALKGEPLPLRTLLLVNTTHNDTTSPGHTTDRSLAILAHLIDPLRDLIAVRIRDVEVFSAPRVLRIENVALGSNLRSAASESDEAHEHDQGRPAVDPPS